MDKDVKNKSIGVRLNESQMEVLQKIKNEGKATSISTAIQYLINQWAILN